MSRACYLCGGLVSFSTFGFDHWACSECGAVFKVVQWNTVIAPQPEAVDVGRVSEALEALREAGS